jgi:hypothetical protein
MRKHTQSHNANDFIRGWYLDNNDLCDSLIDYFDRNQNTFDGHSSNGVDKLIKDSTDCYLEDPVLTNRYFQQLSLVAQQYIELYPYVDHYSKWGISESINIQKYEPQQGYFGWHTERGSASHPQSSRHMVFMTYLNDVTDDGETEFYHQNLKVKAEKGLTIIWPADWTHTHRGITSTTQPKYIITGWFNFFGEQ